jgi:hypothetical protein
MATDSFEDPKIMALVRELEGIDEQIYDLSEKKRHILNRLDALDA